MMQKKGYLNYLKSLKFKIMKYKINVFLKKSVKLIISLLKKLNELRKDF